MNNETFEEPFATKKETNCSVEWMKRQNERRHNKYA